MRSVFKLLIGLSAAASLMGAAYLWAPSPTLDADPPPPAVLTALRQNAIPLAGTDPRTSLDDLAELHPIIAGRRIIAMGEATHGSHEFFQAQHRVFRYLVEREGFTQFGMEVSAEAGSAAESFIQGGSGSADETTRTLGLWPWVTEEVRALLVWMREYNAGAAPDRRVHFFGFSVWGPDRDSRMAQVVTERVEASGDSARMFLWAHNVHVSIRAPWMGYHLQRRWGNALYSVGLEFDRGSVRVRTMDELFGLSLGVAAIGPSGPEFYASTLARLDHPVVFLDFRRAVRVPVLAQWLGSRKSVHSIDEMYRFFRISRRLVTWHGPWPHLFDAVLFVRATTPARGL